jgi:DNA-binding response OmpR family regulator
MNELTKILVVEDDLPLLQAIVRKLNLMHYQPIEARTVDDAQVKLNEHDDIKAIWLDHYLIGEKNGIDFIKTLRDPASKWFKTPVIVVSNSTTQDKVNEYKAIGATKYFVKAETSLQDIIAEIADDIEKSN